MRFFIIVFLFVIAAAAASPYLVGYKVESSIRDLVAEADQFPFYEIKVESYERGYRDASAVISVGFEAEMLESITAEIGVTEDNSVYENIAGGLKLYYNFQHGPVLSEHGWGLGWTDITASFDRETYPQYAELFDAVDHDSLIDFSMRIGLTGEGWSDAVVPDIDVSGDEDGNSYSFVLKGVDGETTFTNYGKALNNRGSIDELSLTFDSEQTGGFSMQDLRFLSDMTYTDSLLMGFGDMEAVIGSLSLNADDEFSFEAEDTIVQVSVFEGLSPETLTIRESFRFKSADINGYKVTDADFAFAYVNISKALTEAYINSSSMYAEVDPEILGEYMMLELEPLLKGALKYDPRIDLERLAFKSDDGSLIASGSVGIDSALLGATIDFESPGTLLPAVAATADLKISESLVRAILLFQTKSGMMGVPEDERPTDEEILEMVDMQIEMMAEPMVQGGYINKEDDIYSAVFSYLRGVAAVNGQPIPIPGL